jgi:energy-coupling factor transporter ATP-binding protein EcfA2
VLRVHNRLCNSPEELLTSDPFEAFYHGYIGSLKRHQSRLLDIFPEKDFSEADIKLLQETLYYLTSLPAEKVKKLVDGSEVFFRDTLLLNEFVEQFYNYWRRFHRLVICDSVFDRLDKRPYRTFNDMVESLMHLVRSTYRNIQENLTGNHPKIYRQVSAGAEIGAITLPRDLAYPKNSAYGALKDVFVISQVLIYPPMIFNTPMNKRSGEFVQTQKNPLDGLKLNPQEWLCYPALVGPLLIMVYFPLGFFELGFALSNLFELADSKDLNRKPDAVYVYGVPPESAVSENGNETVFYDDAENDMFIAAVPLKNQYAYFGYLKKMILTLHNIIRMKDGYLPFHGAMVKITLRDRQPFTTLIIGDTGAGKSESLEALRAIASDEIEDLTIIADDMGSLSRDKNGRIIGFGTEMGAFVRLDDLQSGYALGQIDRTIIMNPDQVNARVVMPVTRYEYVMEGTRLDCILYANNYENVDSAHPVIDRFEKIDEALVTFRRGAVMSKGTTTTKGLVETYYANIFGPTQYKEIHEPLAQSYFKEMFDQDIYVGQLRTMLGIPGMEMNGPQQSARALLDLIRERALKK